MKKILSIVGCLVLLASVYLYCDIWDSKHTLTITRYLIEMDRLTAPVRLVHLTDLHNSEFGEGNSELIELVKKQEPDLILMTGDMLNGREEGTNVAENLIRALAQVAPVYAAYGNHEVTHASEFGVSIAEMYTDAGAVFLERAYEDIVVNGQELRLGGIYGFCLSERYLKWGEAKAWEIRFLEEFQDTGRYTVLLTHLPTCWIQNDNLDAWDIDCVLSGHEHGGQIRLPFIGGLYAPDRGFFPGQASGLYYSSDGERVMVLSRGLGSSNWIPRINNVPEVVVIDLTPKT